MNYRKTALLIIVFSLCAAVYPQKNLTAGVVAFYNLENLFDTIDTEGVDDLEFTPQEPKKWNTTRYYEKLTNMSKVIAAIGQDEGLPGGPHIIGLSEIENREVLVDLAAQPALRGLNYQVVHYNSPDLRGVDVGLMYQPAFFKLTGSKSYELVLNDKDGTRIYTRDQLLVSGYFMGEMMHFIVNHWPSRRSGEKASENLRVDAACLTRHIVDSLQREDPEAKIVVMGDLNDDPVDSSVRKHLRSSGNMEKLTAGDLYNGMEPLFRRGVGSLAYRDRWNLFDQIIISQPLLGKDYSSFRMVAIKVFNKEFLTQKDGQFKGYPLRTFVGDQFTAGYSDHFPVYMIIGREAR